jgi:hypothetical protein
MVTNPQDLIEPFVQAGADIITVHAETAPHLHRLIQTIKEHGKKAGVSLNPSTPLAVIEDVLEDCLSKVNGVVDKNKEIEYQLNTVERNMYYCVQKVGIVRYNGFDNVGSDLSFSIAMLDNNDDGIVLSSLYSRDSSSSYAKPIKVCKSKYALSVEELKAIDIAKKTHVANKYTD